MANVWCHKLSHDPTLAIKFSLFQWLEPCPPIQIQKGALLCPTYLFSHLVSLILWHKVPSGLYFNTIYVCLSSLSVYKPLVKRGTYSQFKLVSSIRVTLACPNVWRHYPLDVCGINGNLKLSIIRPTNALMLLPGWGICNFWVCFDRVTWIFLP